MSIVCPTVTPIDAHEFREQLERVAIFAKRIHLDYMDGELAPVNSPPVESAWWPKNVLADLHIMYKRPQEHLAKIIRLKPNLVIVHAEAEGHFVGIAKALHDAGIKAGVALLPDTNVQMIAPSIEYIDHVLIFSGDLGHFGGVADTSLLRKIIDIKKLNKNIEIGWDGGINDNNAVLLAKSGVDVLNVGGYIQNAKDPAHAYAKLKTLVEK